MLHQQSLRYLFFYNVWKYMFILSHD